MGRFPVRLSCWRRPISQSWCKLTIVFRSGRNGGLSHGKRTGKNVQGEKFLCFKLGSEEYGLPVLQVKEIVGMMEFAGVPQTHAYVRE